MNKVIARPEEFDRTQLDKHIARAERALAKFEKRRRKDALDVVREKAASFGFTLEQLRS